MIIRNTRKKPLFSRLQNPNGIVTPPLPLKAVVAQRGASVGIPHNYCWQRKSGGGDKKSSLLGRQASQTAFRLPLKRENPCPFLVCRKKAGVKPPTIPHRTGSARRFFGICCNVSRGVFPWEFQKSRRLFLGKSQIKAMIREIWEASEQHNCRCERSDKKPSRPRKGCSKSLGW